MIYYIVNRLDHFSGININIRIIRTTNEVEYHVLGYNILRDISIYNYIYISANGR